MFFVDCNDRRIQIETNDTSFEPITTQQIQPLNKMMTIIIIKCSELASSYQMSIHLKIPFAYFHISIFFCLYFFNSALWYFYICFSSSIFSYLSTQSELASSYQPPIHLPSRGQIFHWNRWNFYLQILFWTVASIRTPLVTNPVSSLLQRR